jgi:Predicted Fe-S oxidoreductases
MPDQLMESIFEQLKKVQTIKVVVFTGGETTLQKEKLLKGLNLARDCGFSSRVVTNAWWATSKENADQFVKELVDAGLSEINTSFDDYHAKFNSINNIVNFVEASLNNGITPVVSTIVDNYSKYTSKSIQEYLAQNLSVSETKIAKKVFFLEDKPTSSGRGINLKKDVSRISSSALDNSKICKCCNDIGRTLAFHPDGNVKVCCGHASMELPDLNIGNLYTDNLAAILKKSESNLVFWWIHTLGTKGILERLGVTGEYTSICDACRELFLNHRKEMLDYIKNHHDDILLNDILLTDNKRRELNSIKASIKQSKNQL